MLNYLKKIQKEHFNETEKSNIFNHNLIDQGNSIPSSISLVSDNNISDIYKILGINRTINSQIYNITKMISMFSGCSSLITLPDISKWNTSNFKILVQYLGDVSQYYHYLIYQNGILLMSII